MSGYVYAISDGEGRVKIGWSENPKDRLAALQTAHHLPLRLIGFIAGSEAQEQEAHRLLWRHRLRGEWFRYEGPVIEFVKMLPAAPIEAEEEDNPVRAVISALGGLRAVSEITGAGYTAVSNWQGYRAGFPANTYVVLQHELKKRGLSAPADLWNMIPIAEAA